MSIIPEFQGQFRFLSNFWEAKVEFEGVIYPSVENAYQAAKVPANFRDKFYLATPGQCKRFGQNVPLPMGWEEKKLEVMEQLVRAKFKNPELKEKLLSTGHCELQEGNTWGDQFWGISRGKGQNNLGKILMKVRSELQGEQNAIN